MGKRLWVLTMAYICYDDPFCRIDPGVVVEAIGTRRDCLRVLRESVKEVVNDYWDGAVDAGVADEEELACYVKEIMASERDYGSSIKEWTASWENLKVVWRLQRKKVESKKETKKRRTKC